MALDKNFLWGGALAAHQFEGGVLESSKGYSVADVMTAGAHGVPREITDTIPRQQCRTVTIKKRSFCHRISSLQV